MRFHAMVFLTGDEKYESNPSNRSVTIRQKNGEDVTLFIDDNHENAALAIDSLMAQLQRVKDSLPVSVR